MLILWRLLFGHFLADFALQTNFINDWKRSSHAGMIAHCAMHPLCYLALTYPYLHDYWVVNPLFQLKGWVCVLTIFLAHYVEDQWRVFTIFKYNTPDNTLYFIWDQVIHYAVIFAVVPVGLMAPGQFELIPEKWPVLGILAVLATYFCTVLVYFIEKDIQDRPFPAAREKYVGMTERLILASMMLVPSVGVAGTAAAGWTGVMYFYRTKKLLSWTPLNFALSTAFTVLCGFAARWIYYH
jgi:hypothetical protein